MSVHHTLKPSIQHSELIYHELLRRGGFGEVYRATWQSNDLGDIEVAAKKIHIPRNRQDISEDLQNEIQFLKTLKHPSIIEFYGLAVSSDHVVLVTEFASQGSLFDYLQTKTELPRDLKTKWAIQAAHGLKYLRDNNVLHRDIKSPNLLITADDDMKICDFGISKSLTSTKTTKHSDKGSLKWQAPEIFTDELLSPKADIFALGIVLWEMETCEEPYRDQIACHIMYKVGNLNVRPTIPELCPPAVAALIEQCWHGDKDCRPNIEDVLGQLKQLLQDEDCHEEHIDSIPCAKGCVTPEWNLDKKPPSNSNFKRAACSSTPFIRPDLTSQKSRDFVHRSLSLPDLRGSTLTYEHNYGEVSSLSISLGQVSKLHESWNTNHGDTNSILGAQINVDPYFISVERGIDLGLSNNRSSMFDSKSIPDFMCNDQSSFKLSRYGSSRSTGTQTHSLVRWSSEEIQDDDTDVMTFKSSEITGYIFPQTFKRPKAKKSRFKSRGCKVCVII